MNRAFLKELLPQSETCYNLSFQLLVVVAAIAAGILVAEASDDGVLKTLVEVSYPPASTSVFHSSRVDEESF